MGPYFLQASMQMKKIEAQFACWAGVALSWFSLLLACALYYAWRVPLAATNQAGTECTAKLVLFRCHFQPRGTKDCICYSFETGCGRVGLLSLAACPRAARAVSAFIIGVHAYGVTWHVSGGSAGSGWPEIGKRRAVSVCLGAELKSPCSSWLYLVSDSRSKFSR